MFNDDIIAVLSTYSPLFSIKVWNYAQTLLTGAILCNNQRTVIDQTQFETDQMLLSYVLWD